MPIAIYQPGQVNGNPFGNERINAQGSPYLTLSPTELAALSTSDLNRAIFNKIFDTKSQLYFDSLRLLLQKTPIQVSDDVFSWDEQPEQRVGVVVDDGLTAVGTQITAAVGAAPGAYVNQSIRVSAATAATIGINHVLAFSPTEHVVVTSRPVPSTGPTTAGIWMFTVTSLVGEGIPAVVAGATLATLGESVGDEQVGWRNVERSSHLQRTNFVATYRRALQYGRKELAKWEMNGTNNKLQMDRSNVTDQLKYDALTNMWIGRRGTRRLDDGTFAKGMDGIHTQMVQGGATFSTVTTANLAAAFETLAQSTNHQSKGGRRRIYARTGILSTISKQYKEEKIRTRPEDMHMNQDIETIQTGGQTYELICVEPFGDPNFFPGMANNMYVIDDSTIDLVEWSAFPMFEMGGIMKAKRGQREDIPMNVQDGTIRRDLTIRDAELNFSVRMIEPKRSFCLTATP